MTSKNTLVSIATLAVLLAMLSSMLLTIVLHLPWLVGMVASGIVGYIGYRIICDTYYPLEEEK